MTTSAACATLQVYGKSMNGARSYAYRSHRVGPGMIQQVDSRSAEVHQRCMADVPSLTLRSNGRGRDRARRLRLHLLFQDALLGCRIGSVGKHTLVVQLCQLAQLRYPRRLVIRSRGRGLGRGG